MLIVKSTAEGELLRQFQHKLKLENDGRMLSIFPYTVYHVIDASSPLYGLSAKDLLEKRYVNRSSILHIMTIFVVIECSYHNTDSKLLLLYRDIRDRLANMLKLEHLICPEKFDGAIILKILSTTVEAMAPM